ncbi:hypothetical protein L249_4045 [Ophiocordyceps polyrhachis-furcata BCC 54312]|uniref:non-specific serine/threonine protein kinase n=1 Tax=Ophiocordyceps polyrhachis-furcata BCC 54312 TaxID=1330021 RepID=A0A367L577_9HYPO|nr:hypothetical protein L249_4045 [Ophiocordyceps polyrhachis-furcata BCC 54312]
MSYLEEDDSIRFLLPQGVDYTEDIERYKPGGFHPVQLGDRYDDGRYKVVHKLGAGGFATVWLARDENEEKWVALKIVDAEHSASTATKSVLSRSASGAQFVAEHHRHFSFDGPNGRHLCLVLPVLGPSMSELSSGESPFSSPFDVTSPADLLSYIIHTLGEDMPRKWQDSTLWDPEGRPTKDASKGKPHEQWWEGDERSLRDLVYNIWDEPKTRVVQTGNLTSGPEFWVKDEHQPFPQCFSDMVWNPRAIKVDNTYLYGYDEDWDMVLEALPKIPKHEAALLYDLLSKIFVYDTTKRPTAREMLGHPWFHLDE